MQGIILGAGITGLAAGAKTGFQIYEASEKPGGICRSYKNHEYHFEIGGGHWIFGGRESFLGITTSHARNAGVYFNKIFNYPLQKELTAKTNTKKDSLKAWLKQNFGDVLCNSFFYPFNEKYTDGIYDRIVQDDIKKCPKSGKGYNSTFYYPLSGLDVVIDSLAKNKEIHYRKKAVSINPVEKTIKFSDKSTVHYDRLISTIPLKELLNLLGYKTDLPYTSVLVLNIGAWARKNCPKEHWLYVPYCKSGFYRVGFYSNVIPKFAPIARVGVYVEKAYFKREEPNIEKYKKDVVEELQRWGFIGEVEVIDATWIEYAYTWLYDKQVREKSLKILKEMGIESIGRYGKWKFQGIAESFREGSRV